MLPRILVFFACLAVASPLFARELPPDAPPLAVLGAALDLTDDQVTDIRHLLDERSASVIAINEEIRASEAQLRALLQEVAPDATEIGEVVLQSQGLRQEIGQVRAGFNEAFDGLMTPDQLQRLEHLHRLAHALRAIEALKELKIH